VHEYPQLNLRIPPEVKRTLEAVCRVRAVPQWRVVTDAVALYVSQLPQPDQDLIETLASEGAQARPRR
jgi:hypothetical protein